MLVCGGIVIFDLCGPVRFSAIFRVHRTSMWSCVGNAWATRAAVRIPPAHGRVFSPHAQAAATAEKGDSCLRIIRRWVNLPADRMCVTLEQLSSCGPAAIAYLSNLRKAILERSSA